MNNYQGKKIVIIGLGVTGLSCIYFFISRGVLPRVIDTRITPPNLLNIPKNIHYWFGSINTDWLLDSELIISSPGINLRHPSLIAAAKAGIEIIGDIELFCRETKTPIIAITGSNGKSTVTCLVSKIARNRGWKVGTGGNIGLPALMLLKKPAQLYVLELSSFQLETTTSLRATAATILNITEDHMERYPLGIEEYRSAKLRIYNNAQICIVNSDDALTMPKQLKNKNYRSVGVYTGDYHLKKQKNGTWLQAQGKLLLNTDQLKLFGQHNYINALTALALADAVNLPRKHSKHVLISFSGLAHRFQLVHEHNGVRWINDSKATNVASTIAALGGLRRTGVLWLLLGGDGKSANFTPLTFHLHTTNTRVYCFGRDREELAKLNPDITVKTQTMNEAIIQIAKKVKNGDVVLLSPACSSLDQFKNFEHRGLVFTKLAQRTSKCIL
ncbi:UDP-N-acetylmuramoyl-L-alanine--D-glutamate ligase [Candidatus Erwinia haradaeae]|uniref:UDP-N-acetylmuramoylalanine--D-glutamate ligase n=1 Tax=Candidatus Erwinia haradaeae TaxID=1922217 RepID=A0A803FTQ9_9GAMM|nr:UDP-N-acetylmuramoyl-L-alanine--D-glutamate ligase [Candidatus Erwinia haradaeae]VFP88203.1 UDP-N-acetylmuramoylalanine--D-glutamate ligase [Candidatus Erwinia haradaeae]